MRILCSDCALEISEPTVVTASAGLHKFPTSVILRLPSSKSLICLINDSTLRKHSVQSGEDSFWKLAVLLNKPQTTAFQSLVFSDRQVFWPLNLKFTRHKKQFSSLPTAAGFTGVRGELCSLNMRCCWGVRGISTYSYELFHTSPYRGCYLRANWFAKLVLHVAKM